MERKSKQSDIRGGMLLQSWTVYVADATHCAHQLGGLPTRRESGSRPLEAGRGFMQIILLQRKQHGLIVTRSDKHNKKKK